MAKDTTLKKLEAILAPLEKAARLAFLEAVRLSTQQINLRSLEAAIRDRDILRAVEIAHIKTDFLFKFEGAVWQTYQAGGTMVAESGRKAGAVIGFDARHPIAEEWARKNVARNVVAISSQSRAAIKEVIDRQLLAGRNPRSVALEIAGRINKVTGRRSGGIVGLAPNQNEFYMNALDDLESLDDRYFTRKLRDRRYDAVVRAAQKSGRPLTKAQIAEISGRYKDRLLLHRAETIARTESLNALRAGRHDGYVQAIDSGKIQRDSIKKSWDTMIDGRERPQHRAMEGEEVEGIDTPFTLPDGSRMKHAGDASLGAPADQIIDCRCHTFYEVDWLRDFR